MSKCSYAVEQEASHMSSDAGSAMDELKTSQARDLFTQQTGQVLLEMGNLFLHIPPFNEHVDRTTGELLISIGNKLRSRK